jgi:5-methylcytosine-specific restriction endonuclease McrA
MNYATYISSAKWRRSEARLGELQLAGFRCRTCNASAATDPLEVHHRTYERLGRELVGDLTALCRKCHVGVTDILRGRRYALLSPMTADIVTSVVRPAILFDHSRAGAQL